MLVNDDLLFGYTITYIAAYKLCLSCPQEQVAGLETGFEALQARFNELDDQMASAAQVATRIGDRLQVGHRFLHLARRGTRVPAVNRICNLMVAR